MEIYCSSCGEMLGYEDMEAYEETRVAICSRCSEREEESAPRDLLDEFGI